MATDWSYVSKLLEELRKDFEGFHRRINDIERLRYMEDDISLPTAEKLSGIEMRVGLTAELIENVKAGLTTNPAQVTVKPLRQVADAQANASNRMEFWNQFLLWINKPVPVLNELADAAPGLGIGILKGAYYPWPKDERKKKPRETDADYQDRQKALKRKWGPYLRAITVHPLSFYFRLGAGNQIAESVEQCWKPRRQVIKDYKDYQQSPTAANVTAEDLRASAGQPPEIIRPLPYGVGTETLALVTEYWSPDLYQVYVDTNLVFEEDADKGNPPRVRYFIAVGRSSSSRDPDKFGLSVAEIMRHNEPALNRMLTRMAEAGELVVRKRLTLQVPEGYTPEEVLDANNNPTPKTWQFKEDVVEALPADSKVIDPFAGAENIYQAMPFIQLVLNLIYQHGVSPIFKGVSPGAAGSGYRDNSLYLMAKSQFQYLLDSYSNCLTEFICWCEDEVVRADQEVFVGDVSLKPQDIKDYPAKISVNVEPLLPQNIISEGQFWDRMWAEGHITRVNLLGKLREEKPEQEIKARMLENAKDAIMPILIQDVLRAVGILPPEQPPTPIEPTPPAEPTTPSPRQAIGGGQPTAQGEIGLEQGGESRGGQGRQPVVEPGSLQPTGGQ